MPYFNIFFLFLFDIITNYYMHSLQEDSKQKQVINYLSQYLNMHSFYEESQSTQNFPPINQIKDQNISNSCQISILQRNFDYSLTKIQPQKPNTIQSSNSKIIVQQSLSMLLKQYEDRIKNEIDSENYRNDKLIKKLKSTIDANQQKIRQKNNKLIEIEEKFKKHEVNYKKELVKLQNSLQHFKKYFESTCDYTIKRMLDVEQKVSILSDLSENTNKQAFLQKTKQISENVLSIVNSCVLQSSKNRSMTLQKIDQVIIKTQLLQKQINEMKIQTLTLKNYKIKKECIEQHIDRLKDTAKMWESAYGENNSSFILTQQTNNDSSIKLPSPKINDLQQKIFNLKKQIQTYEENSSQYSRKIQFLIKQTQEKDIKIANLEEIIDNLRSQLLKSKQQAEKCNEFDDFSQEKVEKLETQFKIYEQAMNQQIRMLKQLIKKKQAEIKILKGNNEVQYHHPMEHLYVQNDEQFKKIIKKKSQLSFGIRQSFDHSLQFSISPANSVSKLSQKINRYSVEVSNKNEDEKRIQKQFEQVVSYNQQLLKENKILLNAVSELQRSYGDCLNFLQMHETKSRQMETIIKQLHDKTEQYQKTNILLQGQNEHLKEELNKQKTRRLKKKMAEQDSKLLTKLTALSQKYDRQQQNYPLTHRHPLKNYNQIEQNFSRKYGETERLPAYQKEAYDFNKCSNISTYHAKSKTKDKSLKNKANYKTILPQQRQINQYQKYQIFTESNTQFELSDKSLSPKNSSNHKKNLRTTPRVQRLSVENQKKNQTNRVDNAVLWSLKRSLQRMNVQIPAICEIDRTGFLKSIQSRTYIINQKGGLFNLNSAQLDLAERKRIITLIH